jgi:hypothetical protein
MKPWTSADITKLQNKGVKVAGTFEAFIPIPKGKQNIEEVLTRNNIPFIQEYKFDKKRKFKADYYIESLATIVEYEGVFSDKSRHTTEIGYSNDCTKYNLAATNGLIVLRYTAYNYDQFEQDILKIKSFI